MDMEFQGTYVDDGKEIESKRGSPPKLIEILFAFNITIFMYY